MDLSAYLKSRGRAAALARELDVSPATVSRWASGGRTPSPQNCVRIERLTQGAVRRKNLRADWRRVWPEL